MLNKKIVIGVGVALLLSSMIMLSGNASAQLEEPVYHKGDYWEYRFYGIIPDDSSSAQGTARVEITDETTITVDEKSYEVWKVTSRINATNDAEEQQMHYYTTSYWRKSDSATIKEILDFEVISPDYTRSSHIETIYKPPYHPDLLYPLNVGDEWERHKECEFIFETETTTSQVDFYYECTGTAEELKTDAGTFSCYVIKNQHHFMEDGNMRDSKDEGNYVLEYRSNKVGYLVKSMGYEDFEQNSFMTLTSYKYQGKNEDGGIPAFEFAFLIIAIASMMLLKRRNERNQ